LVLTDEERKAKKKAYNARPEVKAKAKERRERIQQTPEYKAKRREQQNKYNSTPEAKAKKKAYADRPEVKAKSKQRNSTPEAKAKKKAYNNRPEYKAKAKAWRQRPEYLAKERVRMQSARNKSMQKVLRQKPKHIAKRKEYNSRLDVKAKKKAYSANPEFRKKINQTRKDRRLKVLQHYSKLLSNSNIPCCNCCGENSHVDFLAVDHIRGKKQMDSEPELVKLGYSSKIEGKMILQWIVKNNFPEGFQILCSNCNFAKGIKRNNNQCPHEKMEWINQNV
jgi:hypothetical protein